MSQLVDLISQYQSLTLIGQCKNAGKTTALNHIIRGLEGRGGPLALTSIGRDGESTDRLTGTVKPSIYVRAGTLLATAAGLLGSGDITREILETTGIPTPLGEVVVLRALSDGHVELAGPSMIDQLIQVKESFLRLGAGRVIVDGAISRKTLCSPVLSDATVLSVGASCGKSVEAVAREAGHTCRMLELPMAEDPALPAALALHSGSKVVFIRSGGCGEVSAPDEELTETVKRLGDVGTIFCDGALSEGFMRPIVQSPVALKGITFVVRDASRIMISAETYEKMGIRGCHLRVLEGVRLAAVTVNPFSAYGYHFDKAELMAAVRRQVGVPVFNVEDGHA